MNTVPSAVDNWQPVTDFPKYEINPLGQVRNIDTEIQVQAASFKDGVYVELMREGKPYLLQVRRLVQETFPTGANPYLQSDIERHGQWFKDDGRYEDGEKSHLCGMVCSVGEV